MNEVVTKPKHPGRVAAGKRTAEMNRKRKEDLLRNRKTVPPQVDSGTDSISGGDSSWKYGGAVAILVVGVGFAFYLYHGKIASRLGTSTSDSTSSETASNDNDIFFMN